MVSLTYRLVGSLLLIFMLSACSSSQDESTSQAEVELNRSLWQQSGISDYILDYDRSQLCFVCIGTPPIRVSVVNSEIVAVQVLDDIDGTALRDIDAASFQSYMDVDSFFSMLINAFGEADRVRAEFDEEFGHPVPINIIYNSDVNPFGDSYDMALRPM